ncbi:uncharacterized protein [Argopecten irradians]|uniref:uncharacterized protein isoform X2 n=1 Tax=Argopecten irradians TaxID=31199 RepID=UPI0037221DF2
MTVVSGEQTCYSCAGVARKEDCNRMVECGANEVCFTRRTVSKTGNITFDFGCTQYSGCSSSSSLPVVGRKRDIDNEGSCVRCCDADAQGCSDRDSTNCGCNRDLCGLPDDSRVCFHCDHVIHPSDCTTTGLCYGDQRYHPNTQRKSFSVLFRV